ncbi:LysR substrate-binding domain-containing protein [Microbacterium sp. NPDC089318]
MFDLRSARYFVAVAEELHFGRAAERLQMSQPPLSQAIRQLEADVGAPLFVRTNRRVAMTPAGEAFLPECRQLLLHAAAAAETPRLAAAGVRARITVGAVASALTSLLPEVLSLVRERAPHIAVSVQEIDTHEAVSSLRQGLIDVALARLSSQRSGISSEPLVEDEFCVLLPDDHRLAADDDVHLAELADDPWVWLEREVSPDYHDDMSAACRAAGFSPPATHTARSIASQIALVRCGVGVTIVPATMAIHLPDGVTAKPMRAAARTVTLAVSTRMTDQPMEQLVRSLVKLAADAASPRNGAPSASPPVRAATSS